MVEGAEGGDAEGRPDEASAESLGEDRRLAVPPLLPLEDLLGLRRSGATMQKMYLRQFLLMCREAKLIDNVTGFQEIISFFTSIAQGKVRERGLGSGTPVPLHPPAYRFSVSLMYEALSPSHSINGPRITTCTRWRGTWPSATTT